MNTNNKWAVIYCRVSTKEQVEEGNSLSTQERLCRDYALKNGYEIAEVFIEQGESAKTQDRTELQRLLSFCAERKNRVSVVIAYKIDRISRNTDDYSQIRILLKRYNVEIKSTSEYFENTPAGRFMENIIANVAQFDNDVRTERCTGGMKEAMREGRYVWKAPIGYDNIKVVGKATIAPGTLTPVIRKTFETVALNSIPLEQVRVTMSKQGLLNKAGKPMLKSHFYKMLKNEVYAGWIIKFGERHKGLFEPIVNQELFDQVQRVLKYRKRRNTAYIKENPDFPLRRFVMHPSGVKLTGCWSQGCRKKYPYYRFMLKNCYYRKKLLEDNFVVLNDTVMLREKHEEKFKDFLKKQLAEQTEDKQKEVQRLEKFIAEIKEKQKILIQKNIDGVITNDLVREQLSITEKELFEAHTSLAAIPLLRMSFDEVYDILVAFLKSPGKLWAEAEFPEKLRLQWLAFPQGISFDGTEFLTTEICKIYKVSKAFLASLSSKVDLRKRSYNTLKLPSQTTTLTTITWEELVKESLQLQEILKRIKEYPSTPP